MPLPNSIAQGNVICAYTSRPEIVNNGQRLGKNVEVMTYLDATELQGVKNTEKDKTLGLFFAVSVHEHHLVGLPLVKVPYTTQFLKTCEQADRHHSTYLAITPTENIIRFPGTGFHLNPLFIPFTIPDLPTIAKQMTIGKTFDEVDAYIDLAMPVVIREVDIAWDQNAYTPVKADTKRAVQAYRYVNGLNDHPYTADELMKDADERSAPRPTTLLGPGAYMRQDEKAHNRCDDKTSSPKSPKKTTNVNRNSISCSIQNRPGDISPQKIQNKPANGNPQELQKKSANPWQTRNANAGGGQRGNRRGGSRAGRNYMQNNKTAPWSGQNFNKALALTQPEKTQANVTTGKESTVADTDCSFDRDRKREILSEPWPDEWIKPQLGMSAIVEGLKGLSVREQGWDIPEQDMPVHVHVQQWLGLEDDDGKFKGWEELA